MSYPERNQLAADLCNIIAQMHKIPNTTPYRFANVSGGPIHDHRIDSGVAGPFNSEADLNTALAGGSTRQSYVTSQVPSAYSRTHDSVFTHGNLFFANVLVDGGRLSGILNWDCAAFMPTYWECAKVMRPTWFMPAQEIYRKMWGTSLRWNWRQRGGFGRLIPGGVKWMGMQCMGIITFDRENCTQEAHASIWPEFSFHNIYDYRCVEYHVQHHILLHSSPTAFLQIDTPL
jgi:hypothetical protein